MDTGHGPGGVLLEVQPWSGRSGIALLPLSLLTGIPPLARKA